MLDNDLNKINVTVVQNALPSLIRINATNGFAMGDILHTLKPDVQGKILIDDTVPQCHNVTYKTGSHTLTRTIITKSDNFAIIPLELMRDDCVRNAARMHIQIINKPILKLSNIVGTLYVDDEPIQTNTSPDASDTYTPDY